MTKKEVYAFIEGVAVSQGFYWQLLARLNEVEPDMANEFLDRFADCKDVVDVVMFLEDGDGLF